MAITDNERKVLKRAAKILNRELREGDALTSPDMVRAFLKYRFAGLEYEMFGMLVLDNRHRVIDFVEMFRGTIDSAAVYPRECVKELLKLNGAAVILAHNHPSQNPTPSDTDVRLTRKLIDAMSLIDVRTLDHIVVAGDHYVSLAERGLM